MRVFLRMCQIMDEEANIFEAFDLTEYADFFVASTAKKYRQRGLAQELYKRSLAFLKAEGFKLAKSLFTSPHTRKAVTNLQFKELSRINYTDVILEDGDKVFCDSDLKPEHYASLMAKVL